MRIKKDFIVHDTGSESLLVPTGNADFSGLVKGNKTLGAILEILKRDHTEDEIVAEMYKRYDAPKEVIAVDVKKAIVELRRIGAIEE